MKRPLSHPCLSLKSILWFGLASTFLAGVFSTSSCDQKTKDFKEVTYRLKWLFNTSVVGALYAETHGFFKDRGLVVTIKEGGPERDAIKELELGHAQFGVASADQVIRAASKGAPVIVIAQLFQVNPLQWMYRPEVVSLKTVQDLKGKTIGITFGGNDETILRALLKKYGIATDEVTLFSVRYDYTPFYTGEVDLWPVYQNAEGIVIQEILREAGEEAFFFNPHALGISFVANSVITTEALWEEEPELVCGFVSALLQGWRAALDPVNQQEAVRTVHRFDVETPLEIIEKQLRATRGFVKPSPEVQIGNIDAAAWAQTERIMWQERLIPSPIPVTRLLKPCSAMMTGK
jgi:NitT/TauT family transport system substrate-binding protein